MSKNFVESGIESEDPNMLANQIYESIKEDPEIASFPREAVMAKLVKKVQDRQAQKSFQFGPLDSPEAKQGRREDALAKAAAGRAEIERDFNPDGSEKFRPGDAWEGFKNSVTMGAYPTIAGSAAAAGGAFEDRSLENVKSNYLAGRDETLAGLKQMEQSPSAALGEFAGSIAPAAVPAFGAVSKMGLGAKVAIGAGSGAATGALRTEQNQEAGKFEDLGQTALKAGIGGTIGGAGAGAAHGLGKANAWLREKDSFMGFRPLVDAYDEAGSFKQLIIDKLKSNPPAEKSLQSVINHGSPTMSRTDIPIEPKIGPQKPISTQNQPEFVFDTETDRSTRKLAEQAKLAEQRAQQKAAARALLVEQKAKEKANAKDIVMRNKYEPPVSSSRSDVNYTPNPRSGAVDEVEALYPLQLEQLKAQETARKGMLNFDDSASSSAGQYTPRPRQGSFEQPEPIYPMKLEELKAQEAARKGVYSPENASASNMNYPARPRQGSVDHPEGIYMTPTYKEGVKDLESQMKSQYKQQLDSQKLSQQKSIIDQKAAAKAQADELAQLEYYQPTQKPTFKELDQFQTQQSKQIPQDILPQKPMTYKELEAYSRQQQSQSMRDLQLEDLQTRKTLTGENEDLMQQIMTQRKAEVPEIPQSIRDFEIPQPMQNLEELQQIVSKAPQIQMTPRPQPSINTPSWRPIEGMPFQTPVPKPAGVKSFPEYPEQEWVPQGTYKSLEQRLKEFQARRR